MAEPQLKPFQDRLELVRSFVLEGEPLTLSRERQAEFQERITELEQRFRFVQDESLLVGFVGGTGVGKSTLLNALAKESIASTSQRRPHTDRVLLYRHRETPAPDFLSELELSYQDLPHTAFAIKRIILLDLPDFDSIVSSHRETVLALINRLDLLVLVTSPEKYADREMYDFLERIPQAKSNFYFLLNKVDRIVDPGDGLKQPSIQELVAHYQSLLTNSLGSASGTNPPMVYLISALEPATGQSPSPWNQFVHFEEHLFQQRTIKQISRIKTENLQSELSHLMTALQEERRQAEEAGRVIAAIVNELQQDPGLWNSSIPDILGPWLEKRVLRHSAGWPEPSPLYGPARLIQRTVQAWRQTRTEGPQEQALELPSELVSGLTMRVEHIQDYTLTRLAQHGLPEAIRNRVRAGIAAGKRIEGITSRWLMQIYNSLAVSEKRPFVLFRLKQRLAVWLLTLVLILVLGGVRNWTAFVQKPGVGDLLHLALTTVEQLFSPQGLAALICYALLMLFLGVRFYQGWAVQAARSRQKRIRSLFEELGRDWNQEREVVLAEISRIGRELEEYGARLKSGF